MHWLLACDSETENSFTCFWSSKRKGASAEKAKPEFTYCPVFNNHRNYFYTKLDSNHNAHTYNHYSRTKMESYPANNSTNYSRSYGTFTNHSNCSRTKINSNYNTSHFNHFIDLVISAM